MLADHRRNFGLGLSREDQPPSVDVAPAEPQGSSIAVEPLQQSGLHAIRPDVVLRQDKTVIIGRNGDFVRVARHTVIETSLEQGSDRAHVEGVSESLGFARGVRGGLRQMGYVD